MSGSRRHALGALAEALLRLLLLPHKVFRADVVVILREAVPMTSSVVERLVARARPVVWDVDDALWETAPSAFTPWLPQALRDRGRKAAMLAGLATQVWPGSEVLARWCREHNADVRVLPTVVHVEEQMPTRPPSRELVWIGSPSTVGFLDEVLPALAGIEGLSVTVMGAVCAAPSGVPVTSLPWSPEGEERLLRTARLGLYPVDMRHPLAAGKCGLKAVLYMGAGLPAVVTPSETNAAISRDGLESLHAVTPDDWRRQVERLLSDDQLCRDLSESAHRRARDHYSVHAWVGEVASRLEDALGKSAA